MSDEINDIRELGVGDIISFPIENQSEDRRLIVDERAPQREGTVPLLGEKGGKYHLEQTDDLVHLNFFSPTRTDWIGQGEAPIGKIGVDPADRSEDV